LKRKKIIGLGVFIVIIIAIIIYFIFFHQNTGKISKIGHTGSSQEIVDSILQLKNFETTVNVEIKGNKNQNQYVIKQTYIDDNSSSQEILEPSDIQGVKLSKKEGKLTIENTKLNLSTVLENYQGITENELDLSSFIHDYQADQAAGYEEKQDQIIMKTKSQVNKNEQKTLIIDKNTGYPIKMEIKDANQKQEINILYREVKISKLEEKTNVAFLSLPTNQEI
jgi:outer membrane lipoprotein-sorting protein